MYMCIQVVDKADLLGLDYIWEICLNTQMKG